MSTVSYGTFLGDMSIGPNGTGLRGAFSPNSTRTAHSRRRSWTDTLLDTLPSILSQTKGPTVGSEIPKWFEASTLTDHDEIAAQIVSTQPEVSVYVLYRASSAWALYMSSILNILTCRPSLPESTSIRKQASQVLLSRCSRLSRPSCRIPPYP
jgi:hypothetical protein